MRLVRRLSVLLLPALLLACSSVTPAPLVTAHTRGLIPGVLKKVAVVPFYPLPNMLRSSEAGTVSAAEAADILSVFVTEALEAAGIAAIPPSDLVIAFEGMGQVLPRRDVKATAEVAARDFGATAVMLGIVKRYRDRIGSAAGARVPASVWFEVALHAAPGGERVFTARFEQTQPALSANPLLVRKYPGRGTRWLAASEMARWGADLIVEKLPQELR